VQTARNEPSMADWQFAKSLIIIIIIIIIISLLLLDFSNRFIDQHWKLNSYSYILVPSETCRQNAYFTPTTFSVNQEHEQNCNESLRAFAARFAVNKHPIVA
jgi:hypothetical protein